MLNHRIPEQIKQDVIEVMTFVESTLPICPKDEQDYLFEVYNKYIKPVYQDDLKDTCSRCRSEVIGKIRLIVNTWKQ